MLSFFDFFFFRDFFVHIVFFVKRIEDFNIEKIGPEIENHEIFPQKCNVTIAQIFNKRLIKVKVWERGAGLTKACGTAACATVVAGNIKKLGGEIKELGLNPFKKDLRVNWVDGKIVAETTDQVFLTSDIAVDGILSVLEQDV